MITQNGHKHDIDPLSNADVKRKQASTFSVKNKVVQRLDNQIA